MISLDAPDPVRYANRLQEQARRVLRERSVLALAKKLGETAIVGSLSYELMVRRDIDLCVRLPTRGARDGFIALGADLTSALTAHRSLYIDCNRYKVGPFGDENGLYVGIEFLYCHGTWKLDIWGESGRRFDQNVAYSNHWAVHLKNCDRRRLLLLKAWAAKQVGYSSEAVYEAATHGIYRRNEFKAWLWQRMQAKNSDY